MIDNKITVDEEPFKYRSSIVVDRKQRVFFEGYDSFLYVVEDNGIEAEIRVRSAFTDNLKAILTNHKILWKIKPEKKEKIDVTLRGKIDENITKISLKNKYILIQYGADTASGFTESEKNIISWLKEHNIEYNMPGCIRFCTIPTQEELSGPQSMEKQIASIIDKRKSYLSTY